MTKEEFFDFMKTAVEGDKIKNIGNGAVLTLNSSYEFFDDHFNIQLLHTIINEIESYILLREPRKTQFVLSIPKDRLHHLFGDDFSWEKAVDTISNFGYAEHAEALFKIWVTLEEKF